MNIYALLLIVVPIFFAVMYLLGDNKKYYKILSYMLCLFGIVTSVLLAITLSGGYSFVLKGSGMEIAELIVAAIEILIIVFIFYMSLKHKRKNVFILNLISTILFVYSEFFMTKAESLRFNIDSLSILMLLIVNIIGTLIVVFATGYISEYEHHRKMKSRQKMFYFVVCIFIAAMNGLLMSDSLGLIFLFWEITTISSFLLISYNKDQEAWNSGFRALLLNVIGGICFSLGNILYQNMMDINTLTGIIKHGKVGSIFIIPLFLLCIAGFTKSAQLPFQSWLLGAMVAPTPVSALLHSSTMVKAGVYLIVKLSPAYAGSTLGTAIAIYGGFTFMICSAIAISQRNAKRVLAYSTIANLGLIICSAGMGTPTAISAAMILIVFHAVSKALLFLCTGQIEHTIGSRDIEDMVGLIHVAPLLALITCFGIITMILPPFGVLVTKWLSIEASASNPFVVIFLVLGSALTTLYYIKWMGSILSYPENKIERQKSPDFSIYMPLTILSILALVTSIFVTPVYNMFIEPEISSLLPNIKYALTVNKGNVTSAMGAFNNEIVFIILAAVIVVAILIRSLLITRTDKKNIYMCGENNVEGDQTSFRNANGVYDKAIVSNLYLSQVLNEKTLTQLGYIVSISLILIVLLGGLS